MRGDIIRTIYYKGFVTTIEAGKKHWDNPLDTGCWDNMQYSATHRGYSFGQKEYKGLYNPSDYGSGKEAVKEIKKSQEYIYHTFIQCDDYRSNGVRLTRCNDDEATRRFTGFIWITKEQFKAIKADSPEYYRKNNIDLRKVQDVCDRYIDDMLKEYVEWCNGDTYYACRQLSHDKVRSFVHEIDSIWHEYSTDDIEKQVEDYIDTNLVSLQKEIAEATEKDIAELQQYKVSA